MPAALPRYALVSFVHHHHKVHAGDEFDLHHELVELRPDLFTTEPPALPAQTKPKKEAV